MRKTDFYTFNNKEDFLNSCIAQFKVLHDDYEFYYCNLCNKINDIVELIKKKKDYYVHRCNVYYTDDECFFVCYKKSSIVVEVLLECNATQIAHKLTRELQKINVKKHEPDPIW